MSKVSLVKSFYVISRGANDPCPYLEPNGYHYTKSVDEALPFATVNDLFEYLGTKAIAHGSTLHSRHGDTHTIVKVEQVEVTSVETKLTSI